MQSICKLTYKLGHSVLYIASQCFVSTLADFIYHNMQSMQIVCPLSVKWGCIFVQPYRKYKKM